MTGSLTRNGRPAGPVLAALTVLVVAVVVAAPARAGAATAPVALSAPLPQPAFVAQGVSSANPAHLVRNRSWDFRQMKHVFNTVALMPGDPTAVAEARAAGLSVMLEFDFKSYFFAGEDISPKVEAVVQQVRSAPGSIVAIHIADRINEKYAPADGLRYLAATGGVLHRELPGVPIIVNVADWQLSCGRPNQSSCTAHDPRFRYETDAVLDQLHDSGYVDGFTIADNLKNNDLQAQRAAWYDARKRWPAPFVLWSTCSQLSFPDHSFPGTADTAASLTQAFMAQPMAGGADGWALWAWHQEYDGAFYSFLDKDGSKNALWQAMVRTSRTELAGPVPSARPRPAHTSTRQGSVVIGGGPRSADLSPGFRSGLGFLVIICVLGLGVLARIRLRHRSAAPLQETGRHRPDDVAQLRHMKEYGAPPRT